MVSSNDYFCDKKSVTKKDYRMITEGVLITSNKIYTYNENTYYTHTTAIKSFILWLLSRKRSVKINIQFAVIYAILFYMHIRIRSIFTAMESRIYERNKILHFLYLSKINFLFLFNVFNILFKLLF